MPPRARVKAPPKTSVANTFRPEQAVHEEIARDRRRYLPEGEDVQTYRDYVAGKHKLQLTEDQQRILKGLLGNKFMENLSRKVVAEARDRLRFQRWTCENAAVAEFLSNVYKLNRVKERQGKIHFDTLRDGNHAVAVNWDNKRGRVRIYREDWWNGREGMFIGYDMADEPVYACKDWTVDTADGGNAIRRVLYWEDRIERYISYDGGATWEQFQLPSDVDEKTGKPVWPLPWLKLDGTPIGIQVIHFRNSGQGEEAYGTSELAGGVIGLIDQINDVHYTMSGGGRLAGFPIITIAGIVMRKDPTDPTGQKDIEPEVAPGSVLYSTSKDTVFGQIQPGSFEGLALIRHTKLSALSVTTQTPLHSITGGDWPSGEALLRAEQPAVGKATTQRDTFENCWASVAHMATEVQNRFGTGTLETDVEKAMIEAEFGEVERRDPLTKSIVVNNLGDRISDAEALRLMDYTEEEAKKILEEKDAEGTADIEKQNLLFSRGVGNGTQLPGRGPATGEPADKTA